MDKLIADSIKLAAEAANDAWKAGYDEGYKAGAKWAIAEAQKLIQGSPLTEPRQHPNGGSST